MIVKYGTPGPAQLIDVKNIPSWVKNATETAEDKSEKPEEPADSKDATSEDD